MELLFWIAGIFLVAVWLGVVVVGPPFVPTLKTDLKKLFKYLRLDKSNHFVDLGAGDGRVLVMASEFGARVNGVEINPFLVLIAKWRLRKANGTVGLGDMWKYKLPTDTTHIFMFGADMFMNKLENYLDENLAESGRVKVICYGFSLPSKKSFKTVGAFNIYTF